MSRKLKRAALVILVRLVMLVPLHRTPPLRQRTPQVPMPRR